ncbi:MAG: YlmC/YmxH family sporulation protein [Oscillospiraceae bacterium]|nr:YlmC/YmxH family sporulation protein [Oscillospiraceae bacterium]
MGCCINDLRDKEVINICDGRKLGCVDDVEVDIVSGRLISIIVPCDGRLFGFVRSKSLVILWDSIEKIGDDIILVKIDVKEYAFRGEGIEFERARKRRLFF